MIDEENEVPDFGRVASTGRESGTQEGNRGREAPNVEMRLEPQGDFRRSQLSRDPIRREGAMRAGRKRSAFEKKPILRLGSQ